MAPWQRIRVEAGRNISCIQLGGREGLYSQVLPVPSFEKGLEYIEEFDMSTNQVKREIKETLPDA
jgi:hypothetical protein